MYVLMNKDKPVAYFELNKAFLRDEATIKKYTGEPLPVGMKSLTNWIENRKASKHNDHLKRLMAQYGCSRAEGFIQFTHAASLIDTFWIKDATEKTTWKDVSLYSNEFNEVISKLAFAGAGIQDLDYSATSPEFTTDGGFRKAFEREVRGVFLYKGGSSGYLNAGMEPYCEILGSELAEYICKNAVHYDLVRFNGMIATKCQLFTDENHGYVPYSKYITSEEMTAPDKMLDFFSGISEESGELFKSMLVLDALTFNTDRHAGNYGVIVDNDSLRPITMAPVFDMNLSMLPGVTIDELDNIGETLLKYEPHIGSDFTETAQAVLTDTIRGRLKQLQGFEFKFRGDAFFTEERVKKLEQIVNRHIEAILSADRLCTSDVFVPEKDGLTYDEKTIEVASASMERFLRETDLDSDIETSVLEDSSHRIVSVEWLKAEVGSDFSVEIDFLKKTITPLMNFAPINEQQLDDNRKAAYKDIVSKVGFETETIGATCSFSPQTKRRSSGR